MSKKENFLKLVVMDFGHHSGTSDGGGITKGGVGCDSGCVDGNGNASQTSS